MTDATPEQLVVNALRGFVDERREFLIVESGPYYVQFGAIYADGMQHAEDSGRSFSEIYAERGLYAEAVSDEHLEPGVRLGEDGAARLERLGWTSPSDAANWSSNWSRVLKLKDESDYARIASCVINTFVDGFCTTEPFVFEVGNSIDPF